ncbi:putative U3 small nucleolar RNA-associated protein 7 [Sorochytrium milnesiophthora]
MASSKTSKTSKNSKQKGGSGKTPAPTQGNTGHKKSGSGTTADANTSGKQRGASHPARPKVAFRTHTKTKPPGSGGARDAPEHNTHTAKKTPHGKRLSAAERGHIKSQEKLREARQKTKDAQMLLTESAGYLEAEGMEKTYKFTQADIVDHLDLSSQAKAFELKLDQFGPYSLDYTRNGRHLLIGGQKGHVATFDWKRGKLGCEIQLKDSVRDVKWLHNETMFAVAQKKYVYIYDQSGLEVHALKAHMDVSCLEFLPYHYLLASVGRTGYLKYQDTSTGSIVAEIPTRLGRCDTMAQNPWNAILHLGHSNGTVTMWAPNMQTPLVRMLCHTGPVVSVAIDQGGRYMATGGLDGQLKVWDVRKLTPLQQYYSPTPAKHLSISQKGLLGVGWGSHISVWKDAFLTKAQSPYMTHHQAGSTIHGVRFAPYEDVLGYGHTSGVASIVVPGSGEPNFDTLSVNPYATVRQRQEAEVHSLLNKLHPDMIARDPTQVGAFQHDARDVQRQQYEADRTANGKAVAPVKEKNKMRGKNRAMRKAVKKQSNVIDARKQKFLQEQERDAEARKRKAEGKGDSNDNESNSVLNRFKRRKA